jgi:DNA repair exonuclease SbcCD ATPase subunit
VKRRPPPTLSLSEQQIESGRKAAAMLAAAGADCPQCGQDTTIFNSRVQQIVREATSWFRTATDGNPMIALRYVAALSEVIALHEELKHRRAKGEKATERIVNATATAGTGN